MASWQGRAVRAAQPATALAGPILALLVLMVCTSQAKAKEPDTNFDDLERYVEDSMAEAHAHFMAVAHHRRRQDPPPKDDIYYKQMAHTLQDRLENLNVYGSGDDSAPRFSTVCYNNTGRGGRSGNEPYDQGALFGGALGNCDSTHPPPPECWSTGGAIYVKYDPPAEEHAHTSVCVVFFSPQNERRRRGFSAQKVSASIQRACNALRGPLMGVIDLSQLANCISTQVPALLGNRKQPRAVLVVPADATPGRVLRRGHLFRTGRKPLGQVLVHSGDLFYPEYKRFPVQVYALGPAEPEV